MAKRKTPTVPTVRTEPEDDEIDPDDIEDEITALQEGLARMKAQLAEQRARTAAFRAQFGRPKPQPPADPATPTRSKKKNP